MKADTTRWPLILMVVVVVGLAACSETTAPDPDPDPDPDPVPVYVGSTVAAVTANVLSAVITVNGTLFDEASLVIRTGGESDIVSPAYPFQNDVARPAALGMLAGTTYDIDVLVTAGGTTTLGETLSFTTGPLPAWIPSMTPVGTPIGDGFLLLAVPPGGLVVDNQGRARWYVGDPDGSMFLFLTSLSSHPNGEYTLSGLQDHLRVHRTINELGEFVGTRECVGRDTRFHEVRVLADGSHWILCENSVPTDLSPRGGSVDGTVIWTTLQRVGSDGTLEFEFNSADHFSLDDIDQNAFVGVAQVNLTHGNAIAFDTDGNILVTWRSLNEVTKIDVSTGQVIWRLGGLASQFTVVDGTRAFERPHGVRAVGPGLIQLLDNGTVAPSRLVRYSLDENTMIATRVLEFITAENSYTSTGGSTEVLPGSGALVSFGTVGKIVEVDASGQEVFDLTGLEGLYVFRASRIPSLYASERMGN